jgi:hypothetical protein
MVGRIVRIARIALGLVLIGLAATGTVGWMQNRYCFNSCLRIFHGGFGHFLH